MEQNKPSSEINGEGYSKYQELYDELIKNNGSLDKTYALIENFNPNIQYYGDTKEKRILNYCRFKSNVIFDRFL